MPNRISFLALILVGSCGEPKKSEPACLSTDDCRAGVCAFDACRSLCTRDDECGGSGACFSVGAGEGVCSLPEERACAQDEQCPSGLVCSDGACRIGCNDSDDCKLDGQLCKQRGCVSTTANAIETSTESSEPIGPSVPAAPSTPIAIVPTAAPRPSAAPTSSMTTPSERRPTPPPDCGDGVRVLGELCDDGNHADLDGCSSWCILEADWTCPDPGQPCTYAVTCGDGVLGGLEDCDDGNTTDADGCDAECKREALWECPVSGMPCLVACDELTPSDCEADPDFCELPCAQGTRCGDGLITGDEECDDRINASHYSPDEGECAPSCMHAPHCGDGVLSVTRAEQCDQGVSNATSTYNGCTTTCQLGPRCGDGVIDPEFEACDDGNLQDNDGCDAQCQSEE